MNLSHIPFFSPPHFQSKGLHFRHTDNTVQWLRAMESVGLPKVRQPNGAVLFLETPTYFTCRIETVSPVHSPTWTTTYFTERHVYYDRFRSQQIQRAHPKVMEHLYVQVACSVSVLRTVHCVSKRGNFDDASHSANGDFCVVSRTLQIIEIIQGKDWTS